MKAERTFVLTLLLFVLASSSARAVCPISKIFASAILGTTKNGHALVTVDSSLVTPLGDEFGQLWQSGDSTLSNNFGGGCPASAFWRVDNLGNYALAGDLGGDNGCFPSGCAHEALTVIVEDFDAAHPAPGVDGSAFFIAWKVNETPALLRQYDFGRTAMSGTVFPFVEFPPVHLASVGSNGMNWEVTYDLADVAANFHGVSGPCTGSTPSTCTNTLLPAEEVIVSYDLMLYVGRNDPGRKRGSWTEIQSTPYPGHGVYGLFASVPFPSPPDDAFLAVGISFDGGAEGSIPSKLVGPSIKLEHSTFAEPQLPIEHPKRKKGTTTLRTSGG